MTETSTDTTTHVETERDPGNPAGINLRYTPPTIQKKEEPTIKYARNGNDPKENIKKFF